MIRKLPVTLGLVAALLGAVNLLPLTTRDASAAELIRPQLGQPIAHVIQRRAKTLATHPALHRSLNSGSLVFIDDVVTTDRNGYLGLELIAGGELRIGPNTRLKITSVTSDIRYPKAIHLELEEGGSVRYIPAEVQHETFPPYRISIKSPAGTVTGSNSDFWIGWMDESYTVLLNHGEVEIATLAGAVTITEPDEGVKLRDIALLPPKPVRLRDRQLERIEATTVPRDEKPYY